MVHLFLSMISSIFSFVKKDGSGWAGISVLRMYGPLLLLFTSNEYEKLRIEHIFDSTIVWYDRV